MDKIFKTIALFIWGLFPIEGTIRPVIPSKYQVFFITVTSLFIVLLSAIALIIGQMIEINNLKTEIELLRSKIDENKNDTMIAVLQQATINSLVGTSDNSNKFKTLDEMKAEKSSQI